MGRDDSSWNIFIYLLAKQKTKSNECFCQCPPVKVGTPLFCFPRIIRYSPVAIDSMPKILGPSLHLYMYTIAITCAHHTNTFTCAQLSLHMCSVHTILLHNCVITMWHNSSLPHDIYASLSLYSYCWVISKSALSSKDPQSTNWPVQAEFLEQMHLLCPFEGVSYEDVANVILLLYLYFSYTVFVFLLCICIALCRVCISFSVFLQHYAVFVWVFCGCELWRRLRWRRHPSYSLHRWGRQAGGRIIENWN